jgi:hypothetical protein
MQQRRDNRPLPCNPPAPGAGTRDATPGTMPGLSTRRNRPGDIPGRGLTCPELAWPQSLAHVACGGRGLARDRGGRGDRRRGDRPGLRGDHDGHRRQRVLPALPAGRPPQPAPEAGLSQAGTAGPGFGSGHPSGPSGWPALAPSALRSDSTTMRTSRSSMSAHAWTERPSCGNRPKAVPGNLSPETSTTVRSEREYQLSRTGCGTLV